MEIQKKGRGGSDSGVIKFKKKRERGPERNKASDRQSSGLINVRKSTRLVDKDSNSVDGVEQ